MEPTQLVQFFPLLPLPAITAMAALYAAILAVAATRSRKGLLGRLLAGLGCVLLLLSPSLTQEMREPQTDIALLAVDYSESQRLAERPATTAEAEKYLTANLAGLEALEVRRVEIGRDTKEGSDIHTRLAEAMEDIPSGRLAGVLLVTDGQPTDSAALLPNAPAPVHVLLTGKRGEYDRRIVVEQAPSFGIVGETVEVRVKVVDEGNVPESVAQLSYTRAGGVAGQRVLRPGEAFTIPFPIQHRGPNVLKLEVGEVPGELTRGNNRAFLEIGGVRDRLKVLLVSGRANIGQRTWRNILKSDPTIDLVHFTILRTPEKSAHVPPHEMSLIPFPVHELFDEKLQGFDLVVFDNDINMLLLPPLYLANIAGYVQKGGAFLYVAGPDFTDPMGMQSSLLGQSLPAQPTGELVEKSFVPKLTETGLEHPITSVLVDETGRTRWGTWFRRVRAHIAVPQAQELMKAESDPLLVVARAGEGRIAQVLSDQIWLWARGYEEGGPYVFLMRRLIHWLMKEPDLEENRLEAVLKEDAIEIRRRDVTGASPGGSIRVTAPSGGVEILNPQGSERVFAHAPEPGAYEVADGVHTVFVRKESGHPQELAEVTATEHKLKPVVRASGGSFHWLEDGMPELRRVEAGSAMGGKGWAGLRQNNDYVVTGLSATPLLPFYAYLLLVLGGLMLAWWREGR